VGKFRITSYTNNIFNENKWRGEALLLYASFDPSINGESPYNAVFLVGGGTEADRQGVLAELSKATGIELLTNHQAYRRREEQPTERLQALRHVA